MSEDKAKWQMEFDREHDGSLSLSAAVFQALGAASVCWEHMEGTGIFQSDRAKAIGDELVEVLGGDRQLVPPLTPAEMDLATALRLTAEYAMLPALPGWSWYDALRRWVPAELAGYPAAYAELTRHRDSAVRRWWRGTLTRHLLVVKLGYWIRPYDDHLDARRWRWQESGGCRPYELTPAALGRLRAAVEATPAGEVRACRGCGCTDEAACDGGCWWVEADLCSSCRPAL